MNAKISLISHGPNQAQALLWLHGFLGSHSDFERSLIPHLENYHHLLIDLPGHGDHPIDQKLTLSTLLQDLAEVLNSVGHTELILVGYSMGGRVALSFGQRYPQLVKACVGLSASPGLKTRDDQRLRFDADMELIDRLKSLGEQQFLTSWYKLPLFKTLNRHPELLADLITRRQGQDPEQLRLALSLMGNGAMEGLWADLPHLDFPVLLLHGEHDPKYAQIHREMAELLPHCRTVEVPETSHAFHLEKPIETAAHIKHFVDDLIEGENK